MLLHGEKAYFTSQKCLFYKLKVPILQAKSAYFVKSLSIRWLHKASIFPTKIAFRPWP